MVAAEAAIPGPLAEGFSEATTLPQAEQARTETAGSDRSGPAQAAFRSQIEALLAKRDTGRAQASAPATRARPPEPLPLWFKTAVLLLAAIVGMTLASWHFGVTGGFYGRLVGHISIVGVALILCVSAAILTVIGRRLRSSGTSATSKQETREGIRLAA
jgi:hypothetical protein